MKCWQFDALLNSQGWLEPAYIITDEQGFIKDISSNAPKEKLEKEIVSGWLVPGLPNAHSHAFQYAMAGLTECMNEKFAQDDFWTWRELMYTLALSITPEDMFHIASMVYSEMLRFGITSVVEFHYLHHDISGAYYQNKIEMTEQLIAAAESTGIQLTLVPVYYKTGDFNQAASERQKRFLFQDVDSYFDFIELIEAKIKKYSHIKLGMGVHSMRAASTNDILQIFENIPKQYPIHMHVAEQKKEVETSRLHLKKSPVEWLLYNVQLGPRFHLVHCTHMNQEETLKLAESQAHVVLCPSTEGNLGDGFFSMGNFINAGGRWSLGSDSQISVNFFEDLRWLDYQQRLGAQKRNGCFQTNSERGDIAFNMIWRAGKTAAGHQSLDYFVEDQFLEGIVIDKDHPLMVGKPKEKRLSTLVYSGDSRCIKGTLTFGQWRVQQGIHNNFNKIIENYKNTLKSILKVK